MKSLKSFFLLSFFLFTVPVCLSAYDKQQYYLRNISVNDGLSQNSVFSIIQDRMGFMWFATKDGLNRYDGSVIRHYYAADGVPGNNYINVLCEADDGLIWMGTHNGVCYYDPLTDRMSKAVFTFPDGSTADEQIEQIVKGPDGAMYIPFGNRGMIVINSGSRRLEWSDLKVKSICFDHYISIGI